MPLAPSPGAQRALTCLITCGVSLAMTTSLARAQALSTTAPPPAPSSSTWFIEQSARVFRNLEHTHVGAETAFGLRWRWLQVGLHAAYRPADWSDHRKIIPLPQGQTYKGKTQVGLAQQFGFAGLHLAPSYTLESLPSLRLALPLCLGAGFLGTPLQGEDRQTPNGERVSQIEDQLTGGQDLSMNLALDVGVRLEWTPWRALGLRFLAGAHYTEFLGYQGPFYDAKDVRSLGASLGVSFSPRD